MAALAGPPHRRSKSHASRPYQLRSLTFDEPSRVPRDSSMSVLQDDPAQRGRLTRCNPISRARSSPTIADTKPISRTAWPSPTALCLREYGWLVSSPPGWRTVRGCRPSGPSGERPMRWSTGRFLHKQFNLERSGSGGRIRTYDQALRPVRRACVHGGANVRATVTCIVSPRSARTDWRSWGQADEGRGREPGS